MIKIEIDTLRAEYIFYENDEYFGKLKVSRFKPKATFFFNESEYLFEREKLFEGKFFCPLKDGFELFAEKTMAGGNGYWISYQDQKFYLKPGELFSRKSLFHFELYKKKKHLGSINEVPKQDSLFLDFRIKLPKVCKCFIFWLGCYSWKNKKSIGRAKHMISEDFWLEL